MNELTDLVTALNHYDNAVHRYTTGGESDINFALDARAAITLLFEQRDAEIERLREQIKTYHDIYHSTWHAMDDSGDDGGEVITIMRSDYDDVSAALAFFEAKYPDLEHDFAALRGEKHE